MARIICDIYKKENKKIWGDDPKDEYNVKILSVNNMYGWLYEKGLLEQLSFEFKDLSKEVCFALDVESLTPYRQAMESSGVEGAALAVGQIFDEEYTPCMYSGAIQLGWPMFTYRDVDGCVGRSWECDLIKGLNTKAIYDVDEVQRTQGVKAAVKSLFTHYEWPERENSNTEKQAPDNSTKGNDPKPSLDGQIQFVVSGKNLHSQPSEGIKTKEFNPER